MSTLTANAPTVKTTTLEIKGATYTAESFEPGFAGLAAVRLVKLVSGESYDVVLTHDGRAECDCPSYEFTYRGTAGTCKHGSACLFQGLLLAPVCGGSPVADVPPAIHAPAPVRPDPVTMADRKRAAYWGLTIPKGNDSIVTPAAPIAVEPIPATELPALPSHRLALVDGEMIVESGPAEMTAAEFSAWMAAHNGDAGGPPMGWVKNGAASVLTNLTPRRFNYTEVDRIQAGADATVARVRGELDRPARSRRFVPTPEDQVEAAALFAVHGFAAESPAPPLGDRSWPRFVEAPSRAFTANRTTDRQVHRRGVC